MSYSTSVAYLLWFIGGWFGLHHFYLGRDTQAFVWATSWGVFGIGYLRDLFRIPSYVAEANNDKRVLDVYAAKMANGGRPGVALSRVICELLIGGFFGQILGNAGGAVFPPIAAPLNVVGTAWGVYLIAGIGKEFAPFQKTLIGATVGYFWPGTSIGAIIAANYYREFRPLRDDTPRRSLFSRLIRVYGISAVFFVIFLAALSQAEIQNERGEPIRFEFNFMNNAWNSPNWDRFYKFEFGSWDDMAGILDIEGEHRALKVLGLDKGAEKEVIVKAYRKCALKYHPDKNKDNPEATELFMACSEAHETLIKIHKRRSGRTSGGSEDRDGGRPGRRGRRSERDDL